MQKVMNQFGEVLLALPVELAHRHRVEAQPKVYYVKGDHDAPGIPGGSICVISGRAGSQLVREARAAADAADAAGVSKAILTHEKRFAAHARGAKRAPAVSVEAGLAALPVITHVSYRGHRFAEGMIVHKDLDAMRTTVPFAGGALDAEGFTAATFIRHASEASDLATLVIVREPQLSDLERKVLDQLPREVAQLSIGRGDAVANWGLVAAAAAFVFVVVAGVYLAEYAQKQMQQDQKQADQQMAHDVAGDQHAQQDQQGQQAQGQDQQQQDQQQQDQGQGQGQADDQHQNGGSLERFFDEAALTARLDNLDAAAAVATLVDLRAGLMLQGRMR